MKIVFDLDNTLTDTKGSTKRPGIEKLLIRLKQEGHELVLWTNSPRFRARDILKQNDLEKYFSQYIYREDYDPERKGLDKDIRKIDAHIIIDDDPKEISYNKKNGKRGIPVKSYVSPATTIDEKEHEEIFREINKKRFPFHLFSF